MLYYIISYRTKLYYICKGLDICDNDSSHALELHNRVVTV